MRVSVGDAFGETFFVNPDVVEGLIARRALAARTWHEGIPAEWSGTREPLPSWPFEETSAP